MGFKVQKEMKINVCSYFEEMAKIGSEALLETINGQKTSSGQNPLDQQRILRNFSLAEVSRFLKKSESSIRLLGRRNKLPAGVVGLNGRRLFTLPEIHKLREYYNAKRKKVLEREKQLKNNHICISVAVANFKGGVGKTSTALPLAQYLCLQGKRVLFVDLDPQASATSLCGFTPNVNITRDDTLEPFLLRHDEKRDFRPTDISYAIKETAWENLDLVPSNIGLSYAEVAIAERASQGEDYIFYHHIKDGIDTVKSNYDVVIMDFPPSLGHLSMAALFACDGVIMPLPPGMLDLASASSFTKMISDVGSMVEDGEREILGLSEDQSSYSLDFVKVLPTRVDNQQKKSTTKVKSKGKKRDASIDNQDIVKILIRKIFGDHVLKSEILSSEAIRSAHTELKTVYEEEPGEFNRETYKRCINSLNSAFVEIEGLIHEAQETRLKELNGEPDNNNPVIVSELFSKLATLCESTIEAIIAYEEDEGENESEDELSSVRRFTLAETSRFLDIPESSLRYFIENDEIVHPEIKGARKTYSISDLQSICKYLAGKDEEKYRKFHLRKKLQERKSPFILGVSNFKGGVGKSTTAVPVAQYLCMKGYKVLVLDLDPQASTTCLLGYVPNLWVKRENTIEPYLRRHEEDLEFTPENIAYAITETDWPGLDLIPSNVGLGYADVMMAVTQANTNGDYLYFQEIRNAIETVKDDYDVVVIDCPPNLGHISTSAAYAFDGLIIPMPPEMPDLASSISFFKMISELGALESNSTKDNEMSGLNYSFAKILHTRVDTAQDTSKQTKDMTELEQHLDNQTYIKSVVKLLFKDRVMSNEVLSSEAIRTTSNDFQTIYDIDPRSITKSTYKRCLNSIEAVNTEIEDMILATVDQTYNSKNINSLGVEA